MLVIKLDSSNPELTQLKSSAFCVPFDHRLVYEVFEFLKRQPVLIYMCEVAAHLVGIFTICKVRNVFFSVIICIFYPVQALSDIIELSYM